MVMEEPLAVRVQPMMHPDRVPRSLKIPAPDVYPGLALQFFGPLKLVHRAGLETRDILVINEVLYADRTRPAHISTDGAYAAASFARDKKALNHFTQWAARESWKGERFSN